jgi:hypothetical protein
MKGRTCPALSGDSNQMLRVIQPFDLESRLCQQMRVPSLPARNVEDSRSVRKAKHVDYTRCFVPIALEREDRLVLQEVLGIEV